MKRNFTKQDFYDLLIPNGECLEWSLSKHRQGYGHTEAYGKRWYAHRLALELEGIDTNGWHVLHSCDNPACCNPSHLRLGTHSDNMKDKTTRDRQPKGSKSKHAKLTENDIPVIRNLLSQGITHREIAKMFGVNHTQITAINTGRWWKHV